MWNSGNQSDNDLSKQVSNMSAALQLRPDCLQQFMSGNLSIEALAAMRPVNPTNEGTSGDMPGPSQMWESLHHNLFPHQYESSPFANILSGASQGALLQQSTVTLPDSSYTDSPFRSPPFTAESSSLMELSTVTPSRIKNSPSAISKGVPVKDTSDIPSTSKSSFPLASAATELMVPSLQVEYAPSSSSTLSEDQFKIVIGNKPTSSSVTDKYTINLDDLNSQPEVSDQPMEVEMSAAAVQIDSDEDNTEDADVTSQSDQETINKEFKKKRKADMSKIPKALRGLMGEANLAYARGAHEDAVKMCMEVVRQAPYAAEPYETLSIIYEEKGETESALHYSLLAAHLSRTTSTKWITLAGMCLNQGDVDKAIDCYTRAAKAKPSDYKLQIEVGKLCMKQMNFQKAIYFYRTAVMIMPPEEGKEAVDLARELARMCHNANQNVCGIVLLEQAFESHPTHVSDEDANLLCELYLLENHCVDIFRLLARHSEMNVVFEDFDNPDYNTIIKLEPPDSMAVDLLCKVAIAAIQLDRADLVEDIVKTICSHNASDTGDIQFEVAEAYINAGKHQEALQILESLVTSREYSLAAVWMRHADCHRALNNNESAMASYKNCLRLAPGHVQAHLVYAKLLRLAEKFSQASQTLDVAENYEIEPEDHVRIYYERYNVFKTWSEKSKKKKDVIALAGDAALLIFANKFKPQAFKEARVFVKRRKKRSSSNPTAGDLKLVQIRHFQLPDKTSLDESDLYLKTPADIFVSKKNWMDFFDEVVFVLYRCRRYKDAAILAEGVQRNSKWFDDLPTRRHFEHAAFCSYVLSQNYPRAFDLIRIWLRSEPSNNALWNYFNQLILKIEDQRHYKFCLRLLVKNPRLLPLIVVAAHNWMTSGNYKTALGEYMYVHKQVPTEPMYAQLVAIAFINLCSQKYTDFKHSLITQALAYFHKYHQLRKLDQECYYNLGRGMHQVGLEHFAIHYYEKALEADPPLVDGYRTEDRFDLRREIAFNLSLIYRKSNNHATANQLLVKYCAV